MQRIILIALLFLSTGYLGCTSKNGGGSDSIVIAITQDPSTLDPRFATDSNGQKLSSLIFHSLVRVGPELKVIGDAADSWSHNNLQVKFELKKGLTFSDGKPVTAEDIYFTFKEYQGPKSPFRSALDYIAKVEADFSKEKPVVILKLKKYQATIYGDLTPVKILPKHVIEKHPDDFHDHLVGSGSFELESRSANQIVLKARKENVPVIPKISKAIFKIIKDDSTLYLKTKKGEVDIVQGDMPPGKVSKFESDSDFEVHKYPGLNMNYILLNLKDPHLKKMKFRSVINQSIDRSKLIKFKLAGLADIATSILTPSNPYFNRELKNSDFDLENARKIVGLNDWDKVTLTLKTSNNSVAVENGKVLANQISESGINVELKSFEWGTFYDDVKKGNFQLATMRWVGAVDPDIYRIALHSNEHPPGRNRGYYTNPLLDKLLDRGTGIENEDERIEHYQAVQRIALEDLPIIPLWYNKDVAIVNSEIKGYVPPLNGDFTPLLYISK